MRRSVVLLGVAIAAVGLSACHGPVSSRTITTTVDCSSSDPSFPGTITNTVTVSLDSPASASVGARIDLANFTVSGFNAPASALANVTITGLAPWSVPGLPPPLTTPNDFVNPGTSADGNFGTETSSITGAVGTDATVDLAGFTLVATVGPEPIIERCTPEAGQPTRLATIAIFDGHGH